MNECAAVHLRKDFKKEPYRVYLAVSLILGVWVTFHPYHIMSVYSLYYDMFSALVFRCINIPMIVCFSVRNNFANIAIERQRINNLAWDRAKKQNWEINCALQERRDREKKFLETHL